MAAQPSLTLLHPLFKLLQGDPSWPGPCYGAVPAVPMAPEQAAAVVGMLRQAFAGADV